MTSFHIEGTSKIHSGVVKWPGRGDSVVWEVSYKLDDGLGYGFSAHHAMLAHGFDHLPASFEIIGLVEQGFHG